MNPAPEEIYVSGEEARILLNALSAEMEASARSHKEAGKYKCPMIFFNEEECKAIDAKHELQKKYQADRGLAVVPNLMLDRTKPIPPLQPSAEQMQVIPMQQPYGQALPIVEFNQFTKGPPTDMELAAILCSRVTLRRIGQRVYLYLKEGYYRRLEGNDLQVLVMEKLRKELSITGQAKQLDNTIKCIMAEPTIALKEWERNKWLMCVGNGILDIRTGTLEPHTPLRFMTTQIQANWYGPQPTPMCDYFFESISGGDPILTRRLWEVLGFLLSSDQDAKRFCLLQGPGNTGKSLYGELVKSMFPSSDTCHVDIFKLGERFQAATLVGKCVNISMDLSNASLKSDAISFVKQVTGRDPVLVEEKYLKPYSTKIDCKFLFGTNHKLRLGDIDDAFLQRILYIPFQYPVSKERMVHGLIDQLKAERNGILFKAVEAYRQVVLNRYVFTGDDIFDLSKMEQTGDSVASSEETLNEFIVQNCLGSPGYFIPTELVYERYVTFCQAIGRSPEGNMQSFSSKFGGLITAYLPDVVNKKARFNGKSCRGYLNLTMR